jgi:hypothetical protein
MPYVLTLCEKLKLKKKALGEDGEGMLGYIIYSKQQGEVIDNNSVFFLLIKCNAIYTFWHASVGNSKINNK